MQTTRAEDAFFRVESDWRSAIETRAARAQLEIRVMAERARRSLGQRVRRASEELKGRGAA